MADKESVRVRDEPINLFVYGTLKQGQLNCSLVNRYARSIERGWISGRLFDVGLFPALAEGDGEVWGEVVRVDPGDIPCLLAVLDRLEGYREEDISGSIYIRRIVDVTTESGGRERAYAYFYNLEHPGFPALETLTCIPNGEWPGPSGRMPAIGGLELDTFEEHVRTYRVGVSPLEGGDHLSSNSSPGVSRSSPSCNCGDTM